MIYLFGGGQILVGHVFKPGLFLSAEREGQVDHVFKPSLANPCF